MEYGDLVHIIWDFQKLEASTQDMLEMMIAQYVPDEEYPDLEDPTAEPFRYTALQRFSDYIDVKAVDVGTYIDTQKAGIRAIALEATTNQFNYPTDAKRLAYGFLNGATDVFPIDSLPDLCRDNVTFTKRTIVDVFLDNRYTLPEQNLEYITAISELFTYPYGVSFSCLFGGQQVFKVNRKVADTAGFTEAEILANNMMIVNDVITNFVFNLGYIYTDFSAYYSLDAASLEYWTKAGEYAGDFVMRFWYR